jgi:hypothetical protein
MILRTLGSAAALLASAAFLLNPSPAASYSSGPPDGFAGEPPLYRDCTLCHGTDLPGDGALILLDLPDIYTPNQTYDLEIQLQDPGQFRWGFELTALDDASEDQGGILLVTDKITTQLSENQGGHPDYLKHTLTGTYQGVPNGPVSWQFQWTAPASGNVTFYAAGNAANGDGQNDDGDVIYLARAQVAAPVTGVPGITPVTLIRMEPSFPNPFRPSTHIPFELAEQLPVQLRVYGVDGRLVATLIDGERPAGRHVELWDGRDRNGDRAESGVYFLTLHAGGVETRQRVVLVE